MFVNGSELNEQCLYMTFGRKIANLDLNHLQTWPPQAILVSDWLISKKSSSLKLLGQMNQNLVGSILGRLSINIAHLVLIR
jgi:hypothetical protein